MKKQRRRILALVLALAFVLTLMPTLASAAPNLSIPTYSEKDSRLTRPPHEPVPEPKTATGFSVQSGMGPNVIFDPEGRTVVTACADELAVLLGSGYEQPQFGAMAFDNPNARFADVTLVPADGSGNASVTLEKGLYCENYGPSGSILFLAQKPVAPGLYEITTDVWDSSPVYIKVLAANSSEKVVSGLGGPMRDYPTNAVSFYEDDPVRNAYEYGDFGSTLQNTLSIAGDGTIVAALTGFNLSAGDITSVTLRRSGAVATDIREFDGAPASPSPMPGSDEIATLKPGGVKAAVRRTSAFNREELFYLELALKSGVTLNGDYHYTMTVTAGGQTYSQALYSDRLSFAADFGQIDKSILYLVPSDIQNRTLPPTVSVTMIDGNGVEIGAPVTATLEGTRYKMTLPQQGYFSEKYHYVFVQIDMSGDSFETMLWLYDIYDFGCYNSDGDWIGRGFPTAANGCLLGVREMVDRYKDFSQIMPVLADDSFMPVSGASFAPAEGYSNVDPSMYKLNLTGNLQAGRTYYLMLGDFPVSKFVASAASQPETFKTSLSVDGFALHGKETVVNVYAFGANTAPAGLTYDLLNCSNGKAVVRSNAALSFSAQDGTPEAAINISGLLPGLYEVVLKKGGAVIGDDDADYYSATTCFQLLPNTTSPFASVIQAAYRYDGQTVSDRAIYFSGYTFAGSAPSGLGLTMYKLTPTFADAARRYTFNASVTIMPTDCEWASMVVAEDLKSAGVTRGEYLVAVTDSSGRILGSQSIVITDGFLSNALYTLSGTVGVKSIDGQSTNPGADIPVKLYQGTNTSGAPYLTETTGPSGQFSFPGLAAGTYTVAIDEGAKYTGATRQVALPPSQTVELVLDSRVPTYNVTGLVKAGDTPVANHLLRLYKEGASTPLRNMVTAADGSYTFNLEEGTYIVKTDLTADYKAAQTGSIVVTNGPVTVPDLVLTLRPFVTGTVTLGGAAKADVHVYLRDANGNGYRSATTGADGTFTFKQLAESTAYTLDVYGQDSYGSVSVVFTSAVSGGTTQNLVLPQATKLTGKVTLDGVAVENAYIELKRVDGANATHVSWAETDADGEYTFFSLLQGDYRLCVSAAANYEYKAVPVTITGASGTQNQNIELTGVPTYKVSFAVNGDGSPFDGAAAISVSSKAPYTLFISKEVKRASGTGNIEVSGLRAGSYFYSCTVDGASVSGAIIVSADTSLTINLPTIYTITGKVTDNGVPVFRATVSAVSTESFGQALTNAQGEYTIKVTDVSAPITMTAQKDKLFSKAIAPVASGDFDGAKKAVRDISIYETKLTVRVTDAAGGAPLADAGVLVANRYSVTNASGVAEFYGLPGDKALAVTVSKYRYLFESASATIPWNSTDNKYDAATLDVALAKDQQYNFDVKLQLSSEEVSSGGTLEIRPIITRNEAAATADLKISLPLALGVSTPLPAGYTQSGGNTVTYAGVNIGAVGESVSLPPVRVTVGPAATGSLLLEADMLASGQNFGRGYTSVFVVNATLNAPGVVKTGETFKVFGNAPSSKVIRIVDADSNATLATTASGQQYFMADVTINTPGLYYLEAVSDEFASNIVPVYVVDDTPPSIVNVKIIDRYGNVAPVNPRYGVPVINEWVSPTYKGLRDIKGSFVVNNLGDYKLERVDFAGAVDAHAYTGGANSFGFGQGTWGGTGIKPIVAVLKKGDTEYHFTIGLVIISIDPSGYVYDKNIGTAKRIAGATATLEIKVDGVWTLWQDPDDLQANPVKTDKDGAYGWMVQNGEYRVLVSADGYRNAIANKADGSFAEDSVIPVPPSQTEVNVPMVFVAKPTVTAGVSSDKKGLVLTFSRPMQDDAKREVSVKKGTEDITDQGTLTWNADKTVLTFALTGGAAFPDGAVYTITVKGAARSADDVAVGTDFSAAVTVPTGSTNPDNPGGGPGGETVTPTTPPLVTTFSDIAGHWAEKDILKAAGLGIVNGFPDGTFRPDRAVTRAEIAKVLVEALQLKDKASDISFTDIKNHWAESYIKIVAAHGYMVGYSKDSFRPDNNITREELTLALSRVLALKPKSEAMTFKDADAISSWAKDGVHAAADAELVKGNNGYFYPARTATRAETVVLCLRVIDALTKK